MKKVVLRVLDNDDQLCVFHLQVIFSFIIIIYKIFCSHDI